MERCNWQKECVELWDANTAFFDALPEKDQLEMIAIKYNDIFSLEKGRKINGEQVALGA